MSLIAKLERFCPATDEICAREGKVLSPYISPEVKAYIPEFKDPAGCWTGTASNYYTATYNTKLVSEKEAAKPGLRQF